MTFYFILEIMPTMEQVVSPVSALYPYELSVILSHYMANVNPCSMGELQYLTT